MRTKAASHPTVEPLADVATDDDAQPGHAFGMAYNVRRVPFVMRYEGETIPAMVHEGERDAAISDPGAAELDVDRTELAARAFRAGAVALWVFLCDAGLVNRAAAMVAINRMPGEKAGKP